MNIKSMYKLTHFYIHPNVPVQSSKNELFHKDSKIYNMAQQMPCLPLSRLYLKTSLEI